MTRLRGVAPNCVAWHNNNNIHKLLLLQLLDLVRVVVLNQGYFRRLVALLLALLVEV